MKIGRKKCQLVFIFKKERFSFFLLYCVVFYCILLYFHFISLNFIVCIVLYCGYGFKSPNYVHISRFLKVKSEG